MEIGLELCVFENVDTMLLTKFILYFSAAQKIILRLSIT